MPAPPTSLVTGFRQGTVARHLCLLHYHPGGTIAIWDGVGTINLSGVDYVGLGGLLRVDRVSDSRDLQNHDVLITVAGLSASALQTDLGEVNGVTTFVNAVWLDSAATVVASKAVFVGFGNNVRTRREADGTITATLSLRAPLADWRAAPRAYYVPTHQKRIHAGDNGFDYVKSFENAVVTGWSRIAETTGSVARYLVAGGGNPTIPSLRDSVLGTLLGSHTYGYPPGLYTGGTLPQNYTTRGGSPVNYVEETTGANVQVNTDGTNLNLYVGGNLCYIDIAGDVRSAGGKLLFPSGTGATHRLRKQSVLTAFGGAPYTEITQSAVAPQFMMKVGGTISGADMTAALYTNSLGHFVGVNGSNQAVTLGPNALMIEQFSNDVVTYTGGRLRVGAVLCYVTSTGMVITGNSRRIFPQGGNPDAEFLRAWS